MITGAIPATRTYSQAPTRRAHAGNLQVGKEFIDDVHDHVTTS